jgi:hypothetical protein
MNSMSESPLVPAIVVGCLSPGTIRIIIHPGCGLADGGIPQDVAATSIPPDLQMPNTELWLECDQQGNMTAVRRRR